MNNVVYRPEMEEIRQCLSPWINRFSPSDLEKLLHGMNWEAWNGLPSEYEFEPARTRDDVQLTRERASAWSSQGPNHYIYVVPQARLALEARPMHPLLAVGSRAKGRINFFSVTARPEDDDIRDVIRHAQELNFGSWRETANAVETAARRLARTGTE